MRNTILIILALNICIVGFSQCDSTYIFCDQMDIDSFQSWYGPCGTVLSIKFENSDSCNITNLEGLRGITSINSLQFFGKAARNISSLEGLNDVDYIANLGFDLPNLDSSEFESLEIIGSLNHHYSGNVKDLSMYRNVNRIGIMRLNGDGWITGLEKFNHRRSFSFSMFNNSFANDLRHVLNGNVTSMALLDFQNCSNQSFDGLEAYNEIGAYRHINCKNFDLRPILNAQISGLELMGSDSTINMDGGFVNASKLYRLTIEGTHLLNSLDGVVPNIEEVTDYITLNDNQLLLDISAISEIPVMQEITITLSNKDNRLEILNNPVLDFCTNKFVCQMLFDQGDSTSVMNNGEFCEQDYLVSEGCLTAVDDRKSTSLELFPNPVKDEFTMGFDEGEYVIYNSQGQRMKMGVFNGGKANVSELPKGTYIIEVRTEYEKDKRIFIKS